MSGRLASQPSAGRWHAIGLIAFLWLVGIYSVKARLGGAGDPRLYGLLGGAVLAAVAAALVGRLRGRQESRALLAGWPVASLLLTTVVGAVDPAVTRDFPGTITITFAYIGLTCPRWRIVALLADEVGHRLLIGVVGREADVDVVAGVGHLDLARLAGVGALEVGAVVLRRGGGTGRADENEGRGERCHAETAHVGSLPEDSRYRCDGIELKISHRAAGPACRTSRTGTR